VSCETSALLEHSNFFAKNVDETCDFLDWLAWDSYGIETSCFDSYNPPPCDICHCHEYNSNSCPYHISADGFAGLTSLIEIMNEGQIEFANKMQQCDLSYKTDLTLSSLRLDVNLCDDGASFLSLKLGLEEVLDVSLTTLPIVAPSLANTLKNNRAPFMTFPDPPFF